ncbi:MAG: alpha-amylase family glycosyl hydrolase [Ilumatobacteraceae bacterium]
MVRRFTVHAPSARVVSLFTRGCHTLTVCETVMTRQPEGPTWFGDAEAEDGDLYWFVADGVGPLLDPDAMDVVLTPDGPRSAVRTTWPAQPRLATPHGDPIVYELHVRGFATTFAGCIEHLPYLVDLGINVIELMPVHPFDTSDNYWGYMPLVWGAVHRPYASGDDAPAELASLVAAAHSHDIEVWLDVVFNHTGEGDATKPTISLRGLDDANAYLHRDDGSYNDDSGCGNVSNPADAYVRELVLTALGRFADLGIDGFRFDLASLLNRDGGSLVELITEWAADRGVRLIAEPWDLAAYQVGQWPSPWLQWNDHFRDEVRGFVRGEAGLVAAVIDRVQGSPDLFENAGASTAGGSVNFLTAHDGLTLHDLTVVNSDHHHSWDCGEQLRLQQLKNYFTMLLLSAGTPMFVMGDEFARTQNGLDNPYDLDSAVTWVDWSRLERWRELHGYVQALLLLRRSHPPADFRFYGTTSAPDTSPESRSLAWSAAGLYVMANAWWEPARFELQAPGPWTVALSTATIPTTEATALTVAPRSMVVWQRTQPPV